MYAIIILLFSITVPAEAQLLLLELDQTIQLPCGSTIWDIIPNVSGSYLWTQATERADDSLIVYSGSTASSDADSFVVGCGSLVGDWAFWQEGYVGHALVSWRGAWPDLENGYAQVFQLDTGVAHSPLWEWHWESGSGPGFYWQTSRHALIAAIAIPPPPAISLRLFGVHSNRFRYDSAGGLTLQWIGTFIPNMLIPGFNRPLPGYCQIAGFGVVSDTTQLAYASRDLYISVTEDTVSVVSRQAVALHDSTISQICGQQEAEWATPSGICCTQVPPGDPSIIVTIEDSVLTAFAEAESIWVAGERVRNVYAVEAITDEPGEEILYWQSGDECMRIRRAVDGYWYGCTTDFEDGGEPAAMRIVAREHEDFRRLAVQIGNTITLYRFGEYLGGIGDQTTTPQGAFLYSNYPNPFNAATTISFDLPRESDVLLNVFDITGRSVATLANGMMAAGEHRVNFEASKLPSGVYVYRLEANGFSQSRKLVVLK